ncbi:MAG: hypothetical protein KKA73_25600 [Chloroflexi bacterium]|nr:hypothetical protein [Chloroflexota bacterium]MBU1751073.1 hypothetical protein [Chloroflexota bacterium]
MVEQQQDKVPLLLWPFWAIWRLLTLILGLTGRLVAVVLGLVLMAGGHTVESHRHRRDYWPAHDPAGLFAGRARHFLAGTI